tara:strand:+ start:6781 stop:7521 length:741 start_codon:yes stop_codon:yes gene_type:complete
VIYLKGKVVVVTGASQGIGKAAAEKFCKNGAVTYFVSRKGSAETVEKLKKEDLEAYSYKCDVTKEASVKEMITHIAEKHSKIDVLVNSAGNVKGNKIENISLEDWKDVIDGNLTSAFLMCKHTLPIMKNHKYGKIINISSIAGRFRSLLAGADYVSAKAGVIGFTRQLSFEAAPYNINANCVCPAQTDTPMLRSVLPKEKDAEFSKNIPIGRIAEPEDIVNVIYFLATEEAKHMAGAIVDVNGGQF